MYNETRMWTFVKSVKTNLYRTLFINNTDLDKSILNNIEVAHFTQILTSFLGINETETALVVRLFPYTLKNDHVSSPHGAYYCPT